MRTNMNNFFWEFVMYLGAYLLLLAGFFSLLFIYAIYGPAIFGLALFITFCLFLIFK